MANGDDAEDPGVAAGTDPGAAGEVTEADLDAAVRSWHAHAPERYRELIDAEAEGE